MTCVLSINHFIKRCDRKIILTLFIYIYIFLAILKEAERNKLFSLSHLEKGLRISPELGWGLISGDSMGDGCWGFSPSSILGLREDLRKDLALS